MIRKSILALLIIVILSGCASTKFNSRTVVIPDTEAEAAPELAHSNGDFEVNKIYRMFEEEQNEIRILGWTDNEQVVGMRKTMDLSQMLQRFDYKNQTIQKVMSFSQNAEASMVSPDGLYIAVYVWDDKRNRTMKLYSLIDGKAITIDDSQSPLSATMIWSNNSRYLSFFIWDDQNEEKLVVYDVTTKKLKKIDIPNEGEKSWSRYAKVSDNGETVLIVKQMVDGQSIFFGKLNDNGIVSLYNHLLNRDGTADFLNNDQILFVSENNLLFAYDRRNKATTILGEQVGNFRLTRDRKYIAYSKDSQNTYIAKLQGNNLLNEQEVFKGINPGQMEWSPSGKKLYLNGWKSFDAEIKSKMAVLYSMHYIIEFK
jgi:Tol biopolymer transport system component